MISLPRNSHSFWIDTAPNHAISQTPHSATQTIFDAAIVGGGIAGITAAFILKQAGLRVVLIEKSRLTCGETGHTTAHLTEIPDEGLFSLLSDFGMEPAHRVLEAGRAAIDFISRTSEHLEIDCDFERLPAYLYSESHSQIAPLEREHWAAQKLGVSTERLSRAPLPFPTYGALSFAHQAQFHPRKYLLGVAEKLPGQGCVVLEETHVHSAAESEPCELQTSRGTIRARKLIITTDSPIAGSALMQTRAAAYRTYAIAVKLASARKGLARGLFWDLSDPYHYIRAQGDWVIIGGEDHKVGMERDTQECFERLLRFANARFSITEVGYRWSGQILEPMDGLPLIGKNPFSRHLFLATGFSGTGMSWGTAAGLILSDLILERANPWIHLFSPARMSPLASLPSYLTENKDYPVCMVLDRVAAPEARSIAEIAPGEGKIVLSGERRVAVYRDEKDGVHALDPTCTHMGCLVRFNNAEKSWDCPCHGSRFSVDGEVLHGPATKALGSVLRTVSRDDRDESEREADTG
jgi:glycine/D-amino acid oxidase-like deaminating enzyme/nitrite reductase/ring-hydroxylating ferredoxin subunit